VVVALRVTRARARVPLYLACVACAGKAVGGWSALARGCWWCSSSPRLMSMGHCSEQRTGFEVTKDWNGADQVAIRSPRGASVRVSCFCSVWDFFSSLAIFPTGDRLGISGLGRKASLGLMCERSVVGAGLPARRAGRLVEEPPRRGAPLQQQ
jgi:hypothetical protein